MTNIINPSNLADSDVINQRAPDEFAWLDETAHSDTPIQAVSDAINGAWHSAIVNSFSNPAHTHSLTGFSTVSPQRSSTGRPLTMEESQEEMYSLYLAARQNGAFDTAHHILSSIVFELTRPAF